MPIKKQFIPDAIKALDEGRLFFMRTDNARRSYNDGNPCRIPKIGIWSKEIARKDHGYRLTLDPLLWKGDRIFVCEATGVTSLDIDRDEILCRKFRALGQVQPEECIDPRILISFFRNEAIKKKNVGLSFDGVDLSHGNLEGIDFYCLDLTGANLSFANLQKACLVNVNMEGADLFAADIRQARLDGASLRGANLQWADLRGAKIREADLREVNFLDADLRNANLEGCNLRRSNFQRADLLGASFKGADLWGCDLKNSRR